MSHGELETKSFRYVGKFQKTNDILRDLQRRKADLLRQADDHRQETENKSRRAKMRKRNR